jgi:hypothetical protein
LDKDVVIIHTYPNTSEKITLLNDAITHFSKLSMPICIVSHYPVPVNIISRVDYAIYDKNNALSDDYYIFHYHIWNKQFKVIYTIDDVYHSLSCLRSIKNAASFLEGKYQYGHFFEHDVRIEDVKSYQKSFDDNIKFIGSIFIGHNKFNQEIEAIDTGHFSFDISWLNKQLPELKNWNDFRQSAKNVDEGIQLEHWLLYRFISNDVLKECKFISYKDFVKYISIHDILKTTPPSQLLYKISETDDHRLILLIFNFEEKTLNIKINYNGVIEEHSILENAFHWKIVDKWGFIDLITENHSERINIDPNYDYASKVVFRFYNDMIKCLRWDNTYDSGLMEDYGDDE